MEFKDLIQIIVYLASILLLTKPLGNYIYKVINGDISKRIFGKIEDYVTSKRFN